MPDQPNLPDLPEGPEPTIGLKQSAEPEGTSAKKQHRTAIIAGVSVLTAAVLGGGAYAAMKFLGSGPQPADALPASTIGLVSIDLRPSAGQLLEARNAVKKFPALKDKANFDTADDLRRTVFERALKDSPCSSISYDKQIKPWLGDSFGFGGVELSKGEITPVAAVQIKDEGAAKKGISALTDCSKASSSDFGYAFNDGFMLISDSTDHAKAIGTAATKHPLKDDAQYSKWTKAAGDSGVVNFFVSKDALTAAVDMAKKQGGSGVDLNSLNAVPKTFEGLGGTLRFADAGLELSLASGSTAVTTDGDKVGAQVADLPEDTSLVLGLGIGKDMAKGILDQLTTSFGTEAESMISDLESQTGLSLPEDLQTLLGKSVVLALGGNAPADLASIQSPSDVPVALDIAGDPVKIAAVVAKLEKAAGASLAAMGAANVTDKDHYVLSTSKDYADSVLKNGSLGEATNLKKVIPDLDKAQGVFFLNFDSDWITSAADTIKSAVGSSNADNVDEVEANLKPLQALGFSVWRDGDESHALVKLTTD